ncbi:MAG: hypothetical protein ACRDTH_28050 [Pseudonocardiaceae bacterium]
MASPPGYIEINTVLDVGRAAGYQPRRLDASRHCATGGLGDASGVYVWSANHGARGCRSWAAPIAVHDALAAPSTATAAASSYPRATA